jgi:hypothetical protein
MLPTKRSAIALARGACTGVRMMRMSIAVKNGVEGGGDLGVAVPDEEPKSGGWRTAPATPPPPPRRAAEASDFGGGRHDRAHRRRHPVDAVPADRRRAVSDLGRRRLRWGQSSAAAGCGTAVPVRTRREGAVPVHDPLRAPAPACVSTGRVRSAIARLAALAGFSPRPLVLDLADQISTHLPEGMIEVALMGNRDEVRPSR